jgi:hypothetical protein
MLCFGTCACQTIFFAIVVPALQMKEYACKKYVNRPGWILIVDLLTKHYLWFLGVS